MLFHVIVFFASCAYLSQVKTGPDMDMPLRIGFIGAGNMAYGIAKGILSGKLKMHRKKKESL